MYLYDENSSFAKVLLYDLEVVFKYRLPVQVTL